MTQDVKKMIKEALSKNFSSYVLITCEAPDAQGEMEVEMTYEGDPAHASYLIHGAQQVIDEQVLLKEEV